MREGALKYDPGRHHRQSIRLQGYDYRQAGAYFVTIVAVGRQMVFGEIVGGGFTPNVAGLEVAATWERLEERFPTVRRDAFVLMPNHAHFVVEIVADIDRGAVTAPLQDEARSRRSQAIPTRKGTRESGAEAAPARDESRGRDAKAAAIRDEPPTLGQIVAFLKYESTKRINAIGETWGARVWQRNYFERVVRGEVEQARIREYIGENPGNWSNDPENPTNVAP